jgi:hypothetical protein
VRALVSTVVALVVGFTVSFVVAPDPTGILPVAVGAVLTGVLSPVVYVGVGRILPSAERST